MLLNELRKHLLVEESEYKYYNFGFDVPLRDIDIPKEEYGKLVKNLSGNIMGDYGDLEDVESTVYDTILSVTGQIKLPSDTSFASHEKSVGELALGIYNEAIINIFETSISDVDVKFLDGTETF